MRYARCFATMRTYLFGNAQFLPADLAGIAQVAAPFNPRRAASLYYLTCNVSLYHIERDPRHSGTNPGIIVVIKQIDTLIS